MGEGSYYGFWSHTDQAQCCCCWSFSARCFPVNTSGMPLSHAQSPLQIELELNGNSRNSKYISLTFHCWSIMKTPNQTYCFLNWLAAIRHKHITTYYSCCIRKTLLQNVTLASPLQNFLYVCYSLSKTE